MGARSVYALQPPYAARNLLLRKRPLLNHDRLRRHPHGSRMGDAAARPKEGATPPREAAGAMFAQKANADAARTRSHVKRNDVFNALDGPLPVQVTVHHLRKRIAQAREHSPKPSVHRQLHLVLFHAGRRPNLLEKSPCSLKSARSRFHLPVASGCSAEDRRKFEKGVHHLLADTSHAEACSGSKSIITNENAGPSALRISERRTTQRSKSAGAT